LERGGEVDEAGSPTPRLPPSVSEIPPSQSLRRGKMWRGKLARQAGAAGWRDEQEAGGGKAEFCELDLFVTLAIFV
jgi:hypothetical protein